MDISMAVILDDLCTLIRRADDEHRSIYAVHVAPRIYELVAAAKAKQHVSRGNPLMLLGLDLVRDETVVPGRVRIR
jgi:hypothetical protein